MCIYIYIYIFQFGYEKITVYGNFSQFAHVSFYLSIYLSIYLYTYLCVCVCVCGAKKDFNDHRSQND